MKKILTVLIVGLLVLVACSPKASTQITSKDAINKIGDKDSFIFYAGSKDCSACQQFSPIYAEVAADYPELLYSIEMTNEVGSSDFESLEDVIGKILVTPTILVIKDGEIVDKKTGILKYSQLEKMIERFELEQ